MKKVNVTEMKDIKINELIEWYNLLQVLCVICIIVCAILAIVSLIIMSFYSLLAAFPITIIFLVIKKILQKIIDVFIAK